MNPNDFHYDFIQKAISISLETQPSYKSEAIKILQENTNSNQLDVIVKLLDLRASDTISICAYLLEDYHNEFIKFLSNQKNQ